MRSEDGWEFHHLVKSNNTEKRIDKFLVDVLKKYTRSSIQKEIKEANILVNNRRVKANFIPKANDIITGNIPPKRNLQIKAENIPIDVIFEDKDIIIVNKPAGMVVHPGHDNYSGTLVNGLLFHYKNNLSDIAGKERPGIVHRLDRDTTGLIIIAKNNTSHKKLAQMMSSYSITRKYHAIVYGNFIKEEGIINAPIGRNPVRRTSMAVRDTNAKEAISSYKVIEQFNGFSYIELKLHTGRTHQLRVHMEYINHPILGDPMYGPKKQYYSKMGQLLHAKSLEFKHPITNEDMVFDSPLPLYFENALKNIQTK